jgi:hypothetical protein
VSQDVAPVMDEKPSREVQNDVQRTNARWSNTAQKYRLKIPWGDMPRFIKLWVLCEPFRVEGVLFPFLKLVGVMYTSFNKTPQKSKCKL